MISTPFALAPQLASPAQLATVAGTPQPIVADAGVRLTRIISPDSIGTSPALSSAKKIGARTGGRTTPAPSTWYVPPLSNGTPLIYVDPAAGVDDPARAYTPAQVGGTPSIPNTTVLPVRTLNFARDLMLSVNGGMNG